MRSARHHGLEASEKPMRERHGDLAHEAPRRDGGKTPAAWNAVGAGQAPGGMSAPHDEEEVRESWDDS